LHARLDHPDRICEATSHDAGHCGSGKVHSGCLDATIELIGYHLLSVAVGEEVDGAGGYHTDQSGPQALEQRRNAFKSVDVSVEYM